MKKPIRFYVSRKNPLTWLAALMSVGAAVLFVLSACYTEELSTSALWLQTVLPVWSALGFAFIALVRGQKEFYRSTKPVFWGCVYFGAVAFDWYLRLQATPDLADSLYGGYQLFASLRYVIVCWLLYLVLYCVYRMYLTGKFQRVYALSLIMLAPVAVLTYDYIEACENVTKAESFAKLANLLFVGSLLIATLAMRTFCDGKYHNTWGDRKDGRRLRTLDPMNLVAGYIMPDRNDANNSIQDTVEISAVERYIHKKRAEGLKDFGIMHVFLAAYVRCVCKYPGLNRFFSGQRVHQRDDDVAFTMTVKKEMAIDSPETTIKLHLSRSDTAVDVYHKLNALIEEVKNTPLDSSFDKLAGLLASIPGLLLKFVVWILKFMDYFGMLPAFLTELSPFHGSVIFTSMGSLGIPPVVHHLYNFGNLPVFLAFGRKYRKYELNADGEVVTKRCVDIVLNTDERTVDGFYYAAVLKQFHKIMRRPDQLDHAPEEIIDDID
ncbi:MAG: hypothetical protein E7434_06520 [Ruminococcaceae bacterium]|nr:hypothetical protein [Oscillospiraceae bacterium]